MHAEELTEFRLRADAMEARQSAIEARQARIERMLLDHENEHRSTNKYLAALTEKLQTLAGLTSQVQQLTEKVGKVAELVLALAPKPPTPTPPPP